ncbi:MAG TPA: hypothetical protein VHJ20_24770 [Polyangia bacterium]|nr:hypothetical protein [Polyangia bacterium]
MPFNDTELDAAQPLRCIAGPYTLNSAIDHQLLEVAVLSWTRTYRANCSGNVTVTSAVVPVPDAIAVPKLLGSFETKTW